MLTPHRKCHQLLNYWTTCWTHCNNAKLHWHHNLKFTFLVMVLAKGHSPPLGFLILINWHWQCCEAHWWTAWRSVETMLNRIDQPWPIQSNVDSRLSKVKRTVAYPKWSRVCGAAAPSWLLPAAPVWSSTSNSRDLAQCCTDVALCSTAHLHSRHHYWDLPLCI